jgi:hypothetical protein
VEKTVLLSGKAPQDKTGSDEVAAPPSFHRQGMRCCCYFFFFISVSEALLKCALPPRVSSMPDPVVEEPRLALRVPRVL